jgi:hypothetical protein
VTVTDRRGHLSNALSFSLPAERRRVGAAAATDRVGILRVTQGAEGSRGGSFV